MSTADKTRLRDHYVSTLEQFEGKILAFDESRRPDEPQAAITDLWWISGSEGFCSALRISSHGAIRVVWRSSGGRRTPQSGSGEWNWYSIAHANVGGVTNARGIFGVSGLDQIILSRDLPRTIGHVLKYSIRTTPCPSDPGEPHYTTSDRLRIGWTSLPVVYETFMSHTGWGKRVLDKCELALAFELPDFVDWEDRFLSEIVPLQMLRAVMDEVLGKMVPPVVRDTKRRKTNSTEIRVSASGLPGNDSIDQHWLPPLKRWLPGSWAFTPIANRAVTADGAAIDLFPWHARIQTVITWCRDEHSLPFLLGWLTQILVKCFTISLCPIAFANTRELRLGLWCR